MDESDFLFLLIAISAFGIAVLNITLVTRLRELHTDAFKELGHPSAFYFAGIQWMFNFKFFSWLWSERHKVLADHKLTRKIFLLRGFWIAFHVGFLLALVHPFGDSHQSKHHVRSLAFLLAVSRN